MIDRHIDINRYYDFSPTKHLDFFIVFILNHKIFFIKLVLITSKHLNLGAKELRIFNEASFTMPKNIILIVM